MAIQKKPKTQLPVSKNDAVEHFINSAPDAKVPASKGVIKGKKQQITITMDPELIQRIDEAAAEKRAFRILCHVKNSTASSHYSVALQNKWLTATMSNSSSGWALSISPVRSSVPDKAASTDCFHSGKLLWFWSVS